MPPTGSSPGARLLLAPFGILYALGPKIRARRWRHRARRLPRPVLSVGNLTFGGTGKTPFVLHACRELQRRGFRPGILSRGYKARGGEANDEALLLRRHLPDVPHVQGRDRFAGGMSLAGDVDCFVLDDGFQHLPLYRDENVVLVDATDPFGGGFCPPAGRLRESPRALERATLVVITRCELIDRAALGDIMRRLRGLTPAPIADSMFRAACTSSLAGVRVLAACGIGNPRAFFATVLGLGAELGGTRSFPDHHAYDAADAAELARAGLPVVVTEKDAVKLEPLWKGPAPLRVVTQEFEAGEGGGGIAAMFDRLARR
ncbi:MAG: tetraacyldisaccharide 4'-kinase [Planctomycetaceae bacterium]